MKRVFIVDDNADKLENLVIAVGKLFPEVEISRFECMLDFERSACHTFEDDILAEPNEYLVLLDMQMPLDKGGPINVDAGFEALNVLFRHDLECPAIIVSSEEIDEAMAEKIYEYFQGFVRYDSLRDMTGAIREVLAKNKS